jgi:hypothetical protein
LVKYSTKELGIKNEGIRDDLLIMKELRTEAECGTSDSGSGFYRITVKEITGRP